MDYVDKYPNDYTRFHAGDMILILDTYATYLVMTKAQSRIAGYYYLGNKPNAKPHPELNGAILIKCKTLKHVVASSAEAETWGVVHNDQTTIPVQVIPEAMHHPQPTTPINTDNATYTGFFNNKTNRKNPEYWDMRYYWLRDRDNQPQLKVR